MIIIMEMEMEKNKLLNELRGGNVFFEIICARVESSSSSAKGICLC